MSADAASDPTATGPDVAVPWWKRAVFYQIYPRSFADGNGDGVGDLPGILGRLDHLVELGVDAVWLSPFYESPMRDNGYDISDHCAVDPVFGTLDDIDAVIAGLHDRGLKLIVDFVPNHVSSDHPWFVEARSSVDSPKRDWFIWADPVPDANGEPGPPTNWTASFTEESAWEFDEASGQYYLHLFLPSQPDLRWDNPEVEAAQHDVLRFWLDRGVDGFRIDVVNAIGKDPEPRSVPDKVVGLPHVVLTHHETAHPLIKRIRQTCDEAGDTMIIGEVVTADVELQSSYQGDGDELHCSVNFASVWAPWERDAWALLLSQTEQAYPYDGPRWPSFVLSNHDLARHRTRYGGHESAARAAAVLLLTVRGTPFLYQGEELGLEDAEIPPHRVVDPGGRDGCRAPIPWTDTPDHGWGPEPWLPFPPEPELRSVAAQRVGADSMFQLYRSILDVRRENPALQVGSLEVVATEPDPDHDPEQQLGDVLTYRRRLDGDEVVVHVNFGDAAVHLVPGGTVLVSSEGRPPEGTTFRGVLAGGEAVVVRPERGR